MKSFDLCMRPRNVEEAAKLAALAAYTGVGGVAVECGEREWSLYRRVFNDVGLEALRRVTLVARKAGDVTRLSLEARQRYDIVAVLPESDEAMRYAARDDRVDLVVYKPGLGRLIDASQAHLHRFGGGAVEVQLAPLLAKNQLRAVMVAVRRAVAYNVPLVVSTCASSVWEYAAPRSIEALLNVLGVPENYAKSFTYATPWAIARKRKR